MALFVVLFVALSGCNSETEPPNSPPVEAGAKPSTSPVSRTSGGIEIFSSPAPAFVYVDGKFMGETDSDAPLLITRSTGPIQLRVACPHWNDGVWTVEIPKGEVLSVKARLERRWVLWTRPGDNVLIGPGQELRGQLAPQAGGVTPVRYVETVSGPVERIVCLVKGKPDVRVLAPDGTALELQLMSDRIIGAPGNKFFRVQLPSSGRYTLEVSGRPCAYSLRWMHGIPPLSGSSVPHLKKRRLAPESFGPK